MKTKVMHLPKHPKFRDVGPFGEFAILGMDRNAKNGGIGKVVAKVEKAVKPKVAEYGLDVLFAAGKFDAMEDISEKSKLPGLKDYVRMKLSGVNVSDVEKAAKNDALDVATAVLHAKDQTAWKRGIDILAKKCAHSRATHDCLQYVCLVSTEPEKANYALGKLPERYLMLVSEHAALPEIRERATGMCTKA